VTLTGTGCTFCGAAGQLVDSCALEDKWSRSFGGDPVVALDHGWYTSASGERMPADHVDNAKFFRPYLRALCDFCAHGWVEDVRWRAEPDLLTLARGGAVDESSRPALVRWAQLTALLAELLEGMPTASTSGQRAAVHAGTSPAPGIDVWFSSLRQALPSRLHLSQIPLPTGLVQVVSIDVAHLSTLVVIPSDEQARALVDRAGLSEAFAHTELTPRLDLTTTAHPQRVAVQRLCTTSTSGLAPTASASG
jgi:hypothetical protein